MTRHHRHPAPAPRSAFLLGAVCLLFVTRMAISVAAAPAQQKATNPHWKPDGCQTCHTLDQGKPSPIAAAAVDEICLKCHDGRKAAAEFHPVGLAFDNKRFTRPEKWPVVDDRLACVTCHDMRLACSPTLTRPNVNHVLLRDYQVGRSQSKPFCRNCHQESAYKKLNPHAMLLAVKDEIIEDKCLFCHTKPLDRGTLARTGDAFLKADQAALCRDCHPQHRDPMQQGHIGMPLSADMLATMRSRELIGLSSKLSPKIIAQVKASGEKPTKMIPDQGGKIICSTCHNPHQAGVFPSDSALAYRAIKPNADGRMISPVRGQAWCKHCHDF